MQSSLGVPVPKLLTVLFSVGVLYYPGQFLRSTSGLSNGDVKTPGRPGNRQGEKTSLVPAHHTWGL